METGAIARNVRGGAGGSRGPARGWALGGVSAVSSHIEVVAPLADADQLERGIELRSLTADGGVDLVTSQVLRFQGESLAITLPVLLTVDIDQAEARFVIAPVFLESAERAVIATPARAERGQTP